MKFLLDSNIVSEASKPSPNLHVLELIKNNRQESSIASVSAFEMLYGIGVLPDGARKSRLLSYLNDIVFSYYEILPYDFECSKTHAQILAKLKSVGQMLPYQDSQIAAIALANSLTLVTRNVKDFNPITKYFPLKIENWFV